MLRILLLALCLLSPLSAPRAAPANGDHTIVEAREAARKRDRSRLAAALAAAQAAQHPLLPWVEYWDLGVRLIELRSEDIEAFYARWPGSYLEDRLRNDWLLELGRRRDWPALAREYPRFRMNDDREVSCYWLLTEHLAGRDVREAARNAWFAQRDSDDGCNMLATAMVDAKRFSEDDVWRKARLAVEANRPTVARTAIGLLGEPVARDAKAALDTPLQYLRKKPVSGKRTRQELRLLALMRVAANDTDVAAAQIEDRDVPQMPAALAAWAWAYTGRQAVFKLLPEAAGYYQRAWAQLPRGEAPRWSDETLAAGARSALRATTARDHWPLLLRTIDAMSAAEQREPTWVYWKARALQATAAEGAEGEAQRMQARRALEALAAPLGFHAQLAAEDLGLSPALPAAPAAPTAPERDAARASPGLTRAQLLAELGLRDESRREWNYTLRGMGDRELLAAARLACEAADWQLCINTSERSRGEIDIAQRYPMPYAAEIEQAAAAAGLDPAFVYGLIRQETRFMPQLRSSAGASGLMQLMPATAKWIAKKTGTEFNGGSEQIHDPVINLRLGTQYLKRVLDDLSGSPPMAAAAYNAGPSRPRRWRDGPVLEPAIWADCIPFNETRDYVKRVLSNSAVYAALLARQPVALKPRLGPAVGPRDRASPVAADLP